MNKDERTYCNLLVLSLYPYIFAAKAQQGIRTCERCGADGKLEVNHKRYGPDITLADLELLCNPCHAGQTLWAQEMARAGDYCSHCQRPF